jgi:hypothetical protein
VIRRQPTLTPRANRPRCTRWPALPRHSPSMARRSDTAATSEYRSTRHSRRSRWRCSSIGPCGDPDRIRAVDPDRRARRIPSSGPPEVLYRPVGDWRRTNRPTRRGIALVPLARFICPKTVLSSSNLPGEQEENQGAVEMQLDCEFTWAPTPGRAARGDDLGPLTKDNTGQVLGFAQATGRTS